eukprot:EG_transcript_35867
MLWTTVVSCGGRAGGRLWPRVRRYTAPAETISATFILRNGQKATFSGKVGQTLMEVARENNVDIEAACDGTCACSTCHMYIDKPFFDKLPKASDDELDMLDLALEVRDTSRLSCQIKLTKELDGITAALPKDSLNQYEWAK